MMQQAFTVQVIDLIRTIPAGKVSTYGRIAALAGNPRAARQISRILSSCSEKEALPWHRVVNREGAIALKMLRGFEEQVELLEDENVAVDEAGRIDLSLYLWDPDNPEAPPT